jgi:hypothetical protein
MEQKMEQTATDQQPEKGRRRFSSLRWITLIGAMLLATLSTVVAASPANAGGGGGCSIFVNSNFNWTQNACIKWSESGMVGTSDTFFLRGFNRDHVTACSWEGTIVSSYGTATTYFNDDCLTKARAGGEWVWNRPLGPGRRIGDKYSWHTCMIVWTSVKYDSCAGAHPASPLLTL